MPGFLKQATASQSRAIGPFVDDTDFKTTKTGLTIANTDIKLIVNGAASANKNSGGGTHRANGVYGVTFDATDTATVGEMAVSVVVASALPVLDKFFVVEEAVYDMYYKASATGATPAVIKRGQDLSNFVFRMTDSTNHNPLTGATVTATRSIDGAAYGAGTIGSVSEIGLGAYKVDIPLANLAGSVIALRFTATGADQLDLALFPVPAN